MFCPYCGKELDDGSIFCIHCGERLEEDKVEAAKETVEKAVEAVTEAVDNAAVAVKETAEKAVETAAETAEKAAEAAAETVEDVAEKAEETAQTAPETTEKGAEIVTDTAEKTEEPVENITETTIETAADTEKAPEEITIEDGGAAKAVNVSALMKNKKVLIIAAAAVVFVVLVVLIAVLGGPAVSAGGSGTRNGYFTWIIDNENVVYYNGSKVKGTDFSNATELWCSSADGSKCAAKDGNGLFYLDGEKVTEITDENVKRYAMSADGSTVAYIFDDEIYIFKNGKSEKVGTVGDKFNYLVISPNGDTVVYAETDDNGRYCTYAIKGGKVIDLDARIYPMSVSNGGDVIYGRDKNNKLCYIKGMKQDSAESVRDYGGINYTSSDNKQIIFSSVNGFYYFDTSLEEAIKITSHLSLSPIFPAGGLESYDDFNSFFAFSDLRIYKYIRKGKDDFDSERLAASGYNLMLSSDSKTLVYINNDGELCRMNVSKPDDEEVLAEDVEGFFADCSLKHIYFGNSDYDVRYYDGKSKKGKKIFSDENTAVSGGVTPSGVLVYADEDGDLYYSDRGGDKKKAGVDDVESITVAENGTVYVIADDTVYVSTDGKKYTKG